VRVVASVTLGIGCLLAAGRWAPAAPGVPDLDFQGQGIGDDTSDPEEESDGWEGIEFGRKDFAEVRRFARLFHIDSNFDDRRAWVAAANQVVRSLTPPAELVPEAWWRTHRRHPFVTGRYLGTSEAPWPRAPVRLIRLRPDRERPGESWSRNQVSRYRAQLRKHQEGLDQAWAQTPFLEADFERVFAWALGRPPEERVPEESRLWIAAAQGFLSALDPHSSIVSAKAWEENSRQTRDGSFEGIGAVLFQRGEEVLVESPIEGQPAFQAGIRAGDVVVAVDGMPVRGLSLRQVIRRVRGPKGSPVTLTIRRLGEPRDLTFTIVRDHIEVRNVSARLLEAHPDVGYIKIGGFVEGTREAVRQAVEDLVARTRGKRLRGLVLDLRNNPGGLLQEAVDLADDFLEDGVIVTVRNASDREETYRARPGAWTFPVVVLVNAASASASEILASALQENGRALVVGERTFGKASVQTLFSPLMRRDYHIKLTVARYYGPSGRTLQVLGVEPDVPVPPAPGKDFPVAFREEDLHGHLAPLPSRGPLPSLFPVPAIQDCEQRLGIAEAMARREARSRNRPDYPMLKAADYLECLVVTGVPGSRSAASEVTPAAADAP